MAGPPAARASVRAAMMEDRMVSNTSRRIPLACSGMIVPPPISHTSLLLPFFSFAAIVKSYNRRRQGPDQAIPLGADNHHQEVQPHAG